MDLFHDDRDRYKYYDILKEVKEKYQFRLHAYCLMTNHIHLLAEEVEHPVSHVMKSIGVRYSMYFNKKYHRVGMLFQNRFRSEAIDSENQFLTCARYIHNNPVKAGIVPLPERYRWSSYQGHLGLADDFILDSDMLLAQYGQDTNMLRSFTCEENEDRFMEFEAIAIEDQEENQELRALVNEKFSLELEDIKTLTGAMQKTVLRTIKASTVLSYRKLADIIGISKDAVYRA